MNGTLSQDSLINKYLMYIELKHTNLKGVYWTISIVNLYPFSTKLHTRSGIIWQTSTIDAINFPQSTTIIDRSYISDNILHTTIYLLHWLATVLPPSELEQYLL